MNKKKVEECLMDATQFLAQKAQFCDISIKYSSSLVSVKFYGWEYAAAANFLNKIEKGHYISPYIVPFLLIKKIRE